jgi:50S ribosomal protein L16 3-hydroxylase
MREKNPGLAELLAFRGLPSSWPLDTFTVHGDPARLAPVSSLAPLRNADSLLAVVRRSPEVRVRLWFTTSDGRHEQIQVPASEAAKLYRQGGFTLVIDAVHRALPEIARFLKRLAADLGIAEVPVGCNAYLSVPGVGSVMHFDKQENFLIQLHGIKRWRVARNEHLEFPFANHFSGGPLCEPLRRLVPTLPCQMPPSCQEVALQPGSVLFLPRGFWHESATEEHSIALTVTFTTPSWADLLLQVLARSLAQAPEWRQPVFLNPADNGEGQLRGRAHELLASLSQLVVQESTLDSTIALATGDERVRRGAARWEVCGATPDGLRLSIDSDLGPQTLLVPPQVERLLKWLPEKESPFPWSAGLKACGLAPHPDGAATKRLLIEAGILDPA